MTIRTADTQPFARGVKESAALAGVHFNTLRRAINAGELKSVRIGTRLLIRDEALLEYLKAKES